MTSPRSPRSAFLKRITVARDTAKTNIDKFRDDLGKNPLHAMEWSNSIFHATAELYVYGMVIENMNASEQVTLQRVKDSIHTMLLNSAQYVNNHSTSQAKNYLNECNIAVMATLLKDIEMFINRELKAA
jgi:hypothetical protein